MGRFTVDRQLAFGGFSAIYLVRDEKRNLFILKEAVVPDDAELALKEEASRLFEREAKLLSSLKHPKIARVFDNFVENGRQYLILQYIPGEDLRQLVRKNGAQKEQAVLKWSLDLADVLAYLHNRPVPVVHRDISPDNLILDEQNILHLIDFGAANLFLGTATGTMIGKQAYMAPEQFRGKANTKSDVYGFGCTLHFLLTGKDPEALTACRPSALNAAISRQLDDLIARCTDPVDEARPSISEVVTHLNVLVERESTA
jgi:serine/threonine-protein kinase